VCFRVVRRDRSAAINNYLLSSVTREEEEEEEEEEQSDKGNYIRCCFSCCVGTLNWIGANCRGGSRGGCGNICLGFVEQLVLAAQDLRLLKRLDRRVVLYTAAADAAPAAPENSTENWPLVDMCVMCGHVDIFCGYRFFFCSQRQPGMSL